MRDIKKCVALPSIALRGIVVFPGCTSGFVIARDASIKALEIADKHDGMLYLVPQFNVAIETPSGNELSQMGVTAKLLQHVMLEDGTYQILVSGVSRAERVDDQYTDGVLSCVVVENDDNYQTEIENRRLVAQLKKIFGIFVEKTGRSSSPDFAKSISKFDNLSRLCDYIASEILGDFEERFDFLLCRDAVARYQMLTMLIKRDIELHIFNEQLDSETRGAMQSKQHELFLREQLAVIKQQLGDGAAGAEYYDRIISADLPHDVAETLLAENDKLAKMPFGTAEATVIRNYIETCLELPWQRCSGGIVDIGRAECILNDEHDGLDEVKKRIIEFLAVKQLRPDAKGQILLLVGPPGVGKTSVAMSVAHATERAFARVSLGGIRDEAEIRGHRRTYVGAMPGRIINALKQAGTSNPVILLDELDKMASDIHGDPAAAMLEVLDPEQNVRFRDNFIEIPVDLSQCIFIATANTVESVPAPLLDRMEIIHINSYTDFEKLTIAKNHLIPKQIKQNGLKKSQIRFSDDAIYSLMRGYTRESGVRSLEREIASVCRKAAKEIVSGQCKSISVSAKTVVKLLGDPGFRPDSIYPDDEVGTVNGLAWTSVGGEMLRVEVLSMPGTGKIELTGSLGDVMKESAHAAVSYIRKHSAELGVDPDFYKNRDLHIHVPEGATPKDGPSAGVTICTAMVSELTGRPAKRDVAMTGEITLTGRVLPIGGLREKSIAAYKAGAGTVIIPAENLHEIKKFDRQVLDALDFIPVAHINEVLDKALV